MPPTDFCNWARALNFYSATFGVAIKPFPENAFFSNYCTFRPEIRYDHSSEAVFNQRRQRSGNVQR